MKSNDGGPDSEATDALQQQWRAAVARERRRLFAGMKFGPTGKLMLRSFFALRALKAGKADKPA